MNDDTTSLNKYISNTGYCSRREADKLIEQGRVYLNGALAQRGNRVSPGDEVIVDGQRMGKKSKHVYIALHKPSGITCTTDHKDPDNIIDYIRHRERIFPIGRLDKQSTGLILLTNDGDIVNRILREKNENEKEYIVKVDRPITNGFLKSMAGGVPILGTRTKRCKIKQLNPVTFNIILTQGLNRQIRRMCNHHDYKVMSLKRIRVMNIKLDGIKIGAWRNLTIEEITTLKARLTNNKK
ncbi:MAG: 23S rRNA pseudouridine(2604) synthase RluF [Bacteroidota bacterium]